MNNDIDWHEYEHRKRRIRDIGLTPDEYYEVIQRIVRDLEWEASLATRTCPNCGCEKFDFINGKVYRCQGCQRRFENADLSREPVAA